jgi:hypothetical protein
MADEIEFEEEEFSTQFNGTMLRILDRPGRIGAGRRS